MVIGKILGKIGNLHYEVIVNGTIHNRHVDQLKPGIDREEDLTIDQSNIDVNENVSNDDVSCTNIIPLKASNTPTVEYVLPNRTSRGKPPIKLNL